MTDERVVGRATAAQRDQVRDALALAFQDDPALSHLFPDPDRRRRKLPDFFTLFYRSDMRSGTVWCSAGGEVAAHWRAPGHAHVPVPEILREMVPLLGLFGGSLFRALRLDAAINARHPKGHYWYLHFLGCRPEHQGKGWGGAAVRAGLAQADADGVPAFLETATPANVGLYQRLGFEIRHEWDAPDRGPRFWSMLRPVPGR